MRKILLIVFSFAVAGCDAERASWMNYMTDHPAMVVCYSGGKEIFKGTSKGKVFSSSQSDGYFLTDSSDGKLKEVSGDCVITYL